jgi:tRNA(Ile)-lysidine synthase
MSPSGPRPDNSANGDERLELEKRFRREMEERNRLKEGDHLLVALSGGLDSLVLLHLLRFCPGLPGFSLHAAHFDHGMRPDSGEDAQWVRGLCRAWDIPLIHGEADPPPATEERAREMRYEFLLQAREEERATWVLTGHHADDQAETVLFRVLRGTGLRGLSGIPRWRRPGILRPLLSFSREQLEAYAYAEGIQPREDSSNSDLSISRNYIRRIGLPGLEGWVAPGARRSLVRLARLARENESAWDSLIPGLLEGIAETEDNAVFIVRSAFLTYHPTVRARLLREVLRRQGVNLSEAGTRAALEFTRTGASGRSISLPGGIRLHREFDRFRLAPGAEPGQDRPLVLPGVEEGAGELILWGVKYEVRWGGPRAGKLAHVESFSAELLDFPLRLRGWVHGDRMSFPYGTKKLKKVFLEAGVAAGQRDRVPVLVDASGNVLWVMGVATSDRARPRGSEPPFLIGMGNVHQS